MNHKTARKHSPVLTEITAGFTTFLSMAYIISVHPAIISQAGMPFQACVTSTVLVCFFSSLMMSLYAKTPLALAPGLGMNGFFTFILVQQLEIPFEQALGAVFWSGVLFLILSIFKIRIWIIEAVPAELKNALIGGIGLFIVKIGFQQAFSFHDIQQAPFLIEIILLVLGLLMTAFLLSKKIKGAFCWSIIMMSFLYWMIDLLNDPLSLTAFKGWAEWPDFSLVGSLDILGSLKFSLIPVIFSLAFVDLLESTGTFMALLNNFKLVDHQGQPKNLKKCFITDATATIWAGIAGSSPATAYLESSAGLKEGGRTGLTSLTTACLFLPFLFLSPLLSMIPAVATAPVLIIVGFLMAKPIKKIPWKQIPSALPSFLVMTLIPVTSSISQGIIWGLISYTGIQILIGRGRKISTTLFCLTLASLLSLFIELYFF